MISTQSAARRVDDAMSTLTDQAHFAQDKAATLLSQGAELLRDRSRQIRESALEASDRTAGYIRDEPFKSVMMAAAGGALIMGLAYLLSRQRRAL